MKNSSIRPEIGLLILTCFWGTSFPLIRGAITSIPPFELVAVRFFIGSCIIFFYTRLFKIPIKMLPISISLLLGTLMFLGFSLQTVGLHYTTSSRSAFFTSTSVIFIPLVEKFFGKKVVSKKLIFALGLICFGIVMMSWKELNVSLATSQQLFIGDGITLICAIALAFHVVLIAKYSRIYDAPSFALSQLIVVCFLGLICHFLFEEFTYNISMNNFLSVAYLGIFITGIITVFQLKFQSKTSGFRAGLVYSSEPIFATLFAFWIEGAEITPIAILGGALMLAGTILSLT